MVWLGVFFLLTRSEAGPIFTVVLFAVWLFLSIVYYPDEWKRMLGIRPKRSAPTPEVETPVVKPPRMSRKEKLALEAKQRAEEANRRAQEQFRKESRKRIASLRSRLKSSKHRGDPYLWLQLADEYSSPRAAAAAYARALALGIPNLRESGEARFRYAQALMALVRRGERPFTGAQWNFTLGGSKRASWIPDEERQARYQLQEAERDLTHHLRSSPDDVGAMWALINVLRALGRPTEAVEHRLQSAHIRRELSPEKSPRRLAADRSGIPFEDRCLSLVTSMGLRAHTTSVTADGGIDIIAFSEEPLTGGKLVIQCKDWENPVGEPVLRELLGVVAAEDAVKGILITSGSFTAAARRFAEGKRIDLIDGRDLAVLEAKLAGSKGEGG